MTFMPFIPLEPGGKRPLVNGWSEADQETIEGWGHHIYGNTGLRLDDFVVIDCDNLEAAGWWNDHGVPTRVQAKTPRGMHFYYRLGPGAAEPPKAGALRLPDGTPMHIDVKTGRKHFVVVPPSKVDHGKWEWLGLMPGAAPLWPQEAADALQAVRDAVRAEKPTAGGEGGLTAFPEGMRHEMLVQNVGLWRRQGWSDEMIGKVLKGLNASLMEGNPLPESELLGIIQSTGTWEPEPQSITLEPDPQQAADSALLRASLMKLPPPMEWLWHPYLPLGRASLIDGYEGIGKGMLSAYAAVQVASGAWGPPAPVLWLSSEDDPEEDIYRRLLAAGWDPATHAEIWFINPDVFVGFPEHIESVEKFITEHGVRLLITDPGREYLTPPDGVKRSFNDEAAIRKPLQALNRMAVRTKCSVMFLHHWNKDSEGKTRTRAGGSGAFVQVVRHRVTLYKAGEGDLAEWALSVTKSNVLGDNALREYRLVAAPEYDTAKLEMGDPIKDYPSGDAWYKARSHELDNPTVGPPDEDVVEFHLSSKLLPGATLPHRSVVAEWCGFSERRVRTAYEELEEQGRIELQANSRRIWKG